MYHSILVSTDGTARSSSAVTAAAKLARTCGANLTIFHAVPEYRMPYYAEGMAFDWPPEADYLKSSGKHADKLLAKARSLAAKENVTANVARAHADAASEAIVKAAAKAKADLIVMASHGRKGLEKLLLGSETQRVLSRSKVPVLVIR